MSRFARNVIAARPRTVAVLALASSALLAALGVQAFGGQAAVVPAPRERIEALTRRATSPLVVYSEFAFEADTIWAADPDNPSDRTTIAEIPHAHSYGVVPALSPDGTRLAVAVLPAGQRTSTGRNADLLIISVASGASKVIAEDIDLDSPAWSPASDSVVVRRVTSSSGAFGKTELIQVAMDGAARIIMRADAQLFAINFTPDGRSVYAARVSSSGTDLSTAGPGIGQVREVAHLSDHVAHDWQLSPDGTHVAYVAPAVDAVMAAWTLDLNSGESRVALPGRGEAQLSPRWEAGGGLTIGVLDGGMQAPARLAANGSVGRVTTLPPTAGFDVPLSWSPDGADLAVRGFSNASLTDAGASWVYVIGTDGSRRKLSEKSDVIVAGWIGVEVTR